MIKRLMELGRDISILFVEDDPVVSDAMSKILVKFCSELFVANDGKEGLEIFSENSDRIDLVISDISMPEMNGLDMLKKINDINPKVHAIIVSAHNDNDNLVKAIELRVEYFLIKPIEQEKLFDVLETVYTRISKEVEFERIKEHEQNRRLLSALEVSYESIVDSIPVPSVIIDSSDRIVCYNDLFLSLIENEECNEMLLELKKHKLNFESLIDYPASESLHPLIEWKDELLNIDDSLDERSHIVLAFCDKKLEFIVRIRKFADNRGKNNQKYTVCLVQE
ncbi:MAG: response regulator transcription factor [Campylobacterales bacterium]